MPLRVCISALAELCLHRAQGLADPDAIARAMSVWRLRAEIAVAADRAREMNRAMA